MNLRTLAVCVLLATFVARALAADFAIESRALTQVPSDVVSAIKAAPSHPSVECKFIGLPVDLSPNRRARGYAVTTSQACDWGAAVGPIWLVAVGSTPTVILAGSGYSLHFEDRVSSGMFNARLGSATAGWSQADLWVYDGTQYVLIVRKQTTR